MRKANVFSQVLYYSGLAALNNQLFRNRPRPLNILAYHRVLPRWDTNHCGDLELISATVDDFRWQMQFIKQHFDPINLDELIDCFDGVRELPPRPVMVTFDDGFQDNYRHALPILVDLGLSATFFVSTGLVGSERPFWFDWICQAAIATSCNEIPADVFGERVPIPEGTAARRGVAERVLQHLKRVPNSERLQAIERLEAELLVPLGAKSEDDRPMNWSQLKEINSAGSSVESHAHEHAVLSTLSPEDIRRDILRSVESIETHLERPCRAISYPVGGASSINDIVLQAIRDANVRLGFTYISGINSRRLDHPYLLRRSHVERYIGRAEFAARMTLPNRFFEEQ